MTQDQIIKEFQGRAMPFAEDNVDTDQIAPTQEALYVLDWKEAGDVFCIKARSNPDCILNDKKYERAKILFGGRNFGCGSSREHATQGTKAKYDVVIATSFAPIYADNAYAIGLPALVVDEKDMSSLMWTARKNPQTNFRVSLGSKVIYWGSNNELPFSIDDAKRDGFLKGTWDERARLVDNLPKTKEILSKSPHVSGF